jgi:hypothetical protein
MTRASLPRCVVPAAVILLALAACSGAELAAPRTLTPAAVAAQRGDASHARGSRTPAPIDCQPGAALTTSAAIGPRGGALWIGRSRLVVPPGALRTSVRITATRRGDASGTVDFQPDGLRFRKSAWLVLDAAGCQTPSDGDASIVHLGEQGEILETIAATFDRRRGEATAPIMHFSGYAIAF